MNPLEKFVTYLVCKFPSPRIVDTWLQEFAYPDLLTAARERGPRLERELDAHGKRLAERAQMSNVPTGRARVIR